VLLRGDRLRLAQAVGNLLANAIEHGEGDVLLRARASAHTVRVEVLDGGPGLPAPVAELVRHPPAGRSARGRGLAIAADVAARHGGRLAAAPSEHGARLVLELPTAAA
jgi:signal transduction histidine kinase